MRALSYSHICLVPLWCVYLYIIHTLYIVYFAPFSLYIFLAFAGDFLSVYTVFLCFCGFKLKASKYLVVWFVHNRQNFLYSWIDGKFHKQAVLLRPFYSLLTSWFIWYVFAPVSMAYDFRWVHGYPELCICNLRAVLYASTIYIISSFLLWTAFRFGHVGGFPRRKLLALCREPINSN